LNEKENDSAECLTDHQNNKGSKQVLLNNSTFSKQDIVNVQQNCSEESYNTLHYLKENSSQIVKSQTLDNNKVAEVNATDSQHPLVTDNKSSEKSSTQIFAFHGTSYFRQDDGDDDESDSDLSSEELEGATSSLPVLEEEMEDSWEGSGMRRVGGSGSLFFRRTLSTSNFDELLNSTLSSGIKNSVEKLDLKNKELCRSLAEKQKTEVTAQNCRKSKSLESAETLKPTLIQPKSTIAKVVSIGKVNTSLAETETSVKNNLFTSSPNNSSPSCFNFRETTGKIQEKQSQDSTVRCENSSGLGVDLCQINALIEALKGARDLIAGGCFSTNEIIQKEQTTTEKKHVHTYVQTSFEKHQQHPVEVKKEDFRDRIDTCRCKCPPTSHYYHSQYYPPPTPFYHHDYNRPQFHHRHYEIENKKSLKNFVDLSELRPSIEELVAKEARKFNMISFNNEIKTSQVYNQEKNNESKQDFNLKIDTDPSKVLRRSISTPNVYDPTSSTNVLLTDIPNTSLENNQLFYKPVDPCIPLSQLQTPITSQCVVNSKYYPSKVFDPTRLSRKIDTSDITRSEAPSLETCSLAGFSYASNNTGWKPESIIVRSSTALSESLADGRKLSVDSEILPETALKRHITLNKQKRKLPPPPFSCNLDDVSLNYAESSTTAYSSMHDLPSMFEDSRHQTKRNKEISVNSKLRQTLEDLELEEQELDMKLRYLELGRRSWSSTSKNNDQKISQKSCNNDYLSKKYMKENYIAMENSEAKYDYKNSEQVETKGFTSNNKQLINNSYILETETNHYDNYETVDDVVQLSYDAKLKATKHKENIIKRQPEPSFNHYSRSRTQKEHCRNSDDNHHLRKQAKEGGKRKIKHKKKTRYSSSGFDDVLNDVTGYSGYRKWDTDNELRAQKRRQQDEFHRTMKNYYSEQGRHYISDTSMTDKGKKHQNKEISRKNVYKTHGTSRQINQDIYEDRNKYESEQDFSQWNTNGSTYADFSYK